MRSGVLIIITIVACVFNNVRAQEFPVFKGAIKANKELLYNNTIKYAINKSLSQPLSDSTEEDWMNAFGAASLIGYKSNQLKDCAETAIHYFGNATDDFKIRLIEFLNASYPGSFMQELSNYQNSAQQKVFAAISEYLIKHDTANIYLSNTQKQIAERFTNYKDSTYINLLSTRIDSSNFLNKDALRMLLSAAFLKGNKILYCFQSCDRNYPGLAIVRDSTGNFVADSNNNIIAVPLLARSVSNMPYYFKNGNTPQGIYKMKGTAISNIYNIGRTPNIQLAMPFEMPAGQFINKSAVKDTAWPVDYYKSLLPLQLQNYPALYESYYAGKLGRTEIIVHGTTVDPDYYKGMPFYPHTPTEGCLSTIELWSEIDGKRLYSNQQTLADIFKKINGARGYCIVVDIPGIKRNININDILPLLP